MIQWRTLFFEHYLMENKNFSNYNNSHILVFHHLLNNSGWNGLILRSHRMLLSSIQTMTIVIQFYILNGPIVC